jgi:hypothetical protein
MATLNVDYHNLVVGQRYIVTYYSNSLQKNATFLGNFNNAQYGVLNFYNVEGPDEMATVTSVTPNRLVSIQVYVNPQLSGPINQQINSYSGGKSKRNRRKYRRSRKYK